MASLKRVPCIDVTTENIENLWPNIVSSLSKCHFLALDLELSGLGPRNNLNEKLIDERYRSVIEIAKTRSVLSFGISMFKYENTDEPIQRPLDMNSDNDAVESGHSVADMKELSNDESQKTDSETAESSECDLISLDNRWKFSVNIYNLICFCEDDYVVEPLTLRFLAGHGFDFNQQCACGLSYHRGNDHDSDYDRSKPSLRNLMCHIISEKIPIVLHNGFIDLIFLYQNLYCDIPNDLQVFLSDLSQMFSSGIFDTKYIADFKMRIGRSYLEYLFYERQRNNLERIVKGLSSISVEFPQRDVLEYRDLLTKLYAVSNDEITICKDYAYHGWCKDNDKCKKSHNIDHILNEKKKQKSKRMKKRVNRLKVINNYINNETASNECDPQSKGAKEGAHRAGYDAFMTGYCFASFLAMLSKNRPEPERPIDSKHLDITDLINNIYLTGKDQPLRVISSSFAKASHLHKEKYAKIVNVSKL